MNQSNHFFNLGYGWLCKHCSAEDSENVVHQTGSGKGNLPNGLPLASWTDSSHLTLTCPRCGIEETIASS